VRDPDSATLHRAHARWVTGEIGFSLLQKKFYTTERNRKTIWSNKPRRDNPYQPFSFDDFT